MYPEIAILYLLNTSSDFYFNNVRARLNYVVVSSSDTEDVIKSAIKT